MADAIDRRTFFALPMFVAAGVVPHAPATQAPEAGVYRFDLPAKTTLWGVITFLGDDVVEVTVASRRRSQSERGRFDGKRLAEFSWANSSDEAEPITLSAKTLIGNRDLLPGGIRFVAQEHLFVGFGQRAKPIELSRRHGGYPHDAAFLGFIVFDA
jgi:hypothetical protein